MLMSKAYSACKHCEKVSFCPLNYNLYGMKLPGACIKLLQINNAIM